MGTILVTGGTGYIGAWVVKMLLERGYFVRLAVRNAADESRYALLRQIEKDSAGTLEIWQSDLLIDGSFDNAAQGCSAVLHLASPFKMMVNDPQKDLLDPALRGTLNVLSAATKSGTVKKVVLTSSVAAVHGDNADMATLGLTRFSEKQFNFSSSLTHQPYSYSKVMAEKAAWEAASAQSQWELVVINPSLVLGPMLMPGSESESLQIMRDIIKGKYRLGVPDLSLGFVDVRDVAKAHILALENPQANGRNIVCGKTGTLKDLCDIIRARYGKRFPLPLLPAPKALIWLIAPLFGLTRKFISRNIGYRIDFNTEKSAQSLGMTYIPLEETVEAMIHTLAG